MRALNNNMQRASRNAALHIIMSSGSTWQRNLINTRTARANTLTHSHTHTHPKYTTNHRVQAAVALHRSRHCHRPKPEPRAPRTRVARAYGASIMYCTHAPDGRTHTDADRVSAVANIKCHPPASERCHHQMSVCVCIRRQAACARALLTSKLERVVYVVAVCAYVRES